MASISPFAPTSLQGLTNSPMIILCSIEQLVEKLEMIKAFTRMWEGRMVERSNEGCKSFQGHV
jgi:hypothetical protein